MEEQKYKKEKPKCQLVGQDGNIFNLMGIASRALNRAGMKDESKEMCNRITLSKSYDEALGIIMEYVEEESLEDEYDEEDDEEY